MLLTGAAGFPVAYVVLTYMDKVHYDPTILYGLVTYYIALFLLPALTTLGLLDRATAKRIGNPLQVITIGFLVRYLYNNADLPGTIEYARGYLAYAKRSISGGLHCGLDATNHAGPGDEITWDAWTTGAKCSFDDNQQWTSIVGGMNLHHKLLEIDRCYTACILRSPPWTEDNLWHGYMTSVPAGRLPSGDYCPDGYYWGHCPPHPHYQPASTETELRIEENAVYMVPK